MKTMAAALRGLVMLMLFSTSTFGAEPHLASEHFSLPASWDEHVVFYHSFSHSAEQAEIPLPGSHVLSGQHGERVAGLTGYGFRHTDGKAALTLQPMQWSLAKPITVSMWWRLAEPMKPETGFHLVTLGANGYISNFVRGKGEWCALQKPTFVIQSYNFPGISNVNGIGYGDGWVSERVWHHVALAVVGGLRVSVYWDGRPRAARSQGTIVRAQRTLSCNRFSGGHIGLAMG